MSLRPSQSNGNGQIRVPSTGFTGLKSLTDLSPPAPLPDVSAKTGYLEPPAWSLAGSRGGGGPTKGLPHSPPPRSDGPTARFFHPHDAVDATTYREIRLRRHYGQRRGRRHTSDHLALRPDRIRRPVRPGIVRLVSSRSWLDTASRGDSVDLSACQHGALRTSPCASRDFGLALKL